jgi:glucokinase
MDYIIGVDLGGTQLRAVLADRTGAIVAEERVLTLADEGVPAVIERIVQIIQHVRAALPANGNLLGVGIGSPGPLDPATGVVIKAPNMPGWNNIPLRSILQERLGLPVELGNDANAAALAEWYFGGGVGRRHMVYITVSTGIGSGVIVDGHLLLGRLGVGGEMGHIPFDIRTRQTWEQMASGTGLGRAAAEAMPGHPDSLLHKLANVESVNAAHVSKAAAQGDALAQQLMEREAELLGIGFATILHCFSPEIILVGGSVVTENPQLLDGVRRVARECVIADVYRDVPIEVATLGSQVGTLGAVALVLDTQHTP